MIEARLANRITMGFKAIPRYDTLRVDLENGKSAKNAQWDSAMRRYTARYTTFQPDQYEELLQMFHACRGNLYSFRFKDWTDYKVANGALGISPAGSTPVQLVKVYQVGAFITTRIIKKPIATRCIVYANGTPVAGTVNTLTGLFTPTSAWPVGFALTWTGEFDVPVCFSNDSMGSTYTQAQIIETDIELEEDFNA